MAKDQNYFQRTFTPVPKERKISNKEFSKLPSKKEVADADKPKNEVNKPDYKKIKQDRLNKSEDNERPFSNYRNNSSSDRPSYNNRNNDRSSSGGYDKKPFASRDRNDAPRDSRNNSSSDRPSYNNRNNDRPSSGGYDKKPFASRDRNDAPRDSRNNSSSDRPSYNNRNNDRPSSGGYDKKPFASRDRNDAPRDSRNNSSSDRPSYNNRNNDRPSSGGYDKKPFASRDRNDAPRDSRNNSSSDRPSYNNRNNDRPSSGGYDKKPFASRDRNDAPRDFRNNSSSDRPSYNNRNNDRPSSGGYDKKPFASRDRNDAPRDSRNNSSSDRPSYNNRNNDRPSSGGYDKKPFASRDRNESRDNKFSGERTNNGNNAPKKNRYDIQKDEWKEQDEKSRKAYTERGGYKGRAENKIENFNGANKVELVGPYVNARGDMYQDEMITSSHNKTNARLEEAELEENGDMPLNKFISHCGISSRREAVEIIKSGRVTVNDIVQTEPAFKVTDDDVITCDGKAVIRQNNLVYLLLNKPKDFVTTSDDEKGRKTVMDLVANACDERIYPVGRLDKNTTGLLLLTNDGELTQKLSHPKYKIKKIYQVGLDKTLTKPDFLAIQAGIELEDGVTEVDDLAYIDEADKTKIGIQIHSGKNRIIRRIFEHLGYEVKQLDRVIYANLTKKNLPRGSWRFLNQAEIRILKHFNSLG